MRHLHPLALDVSSYNLVHAASSLSSSFFRNGLDHHTESFDTRNLDVDGAAPGVMELAPVLTEMASLIFMFIGFALAVPLSAYLTTRLMVNRR